MEHVANFGTGRALRLVVVDSEGRLRSSPDAVKQPSCFGCSEGTVIGSTKAVRSGTLCSQKPSCRHSTCPFRARVISEFRARLRVVVVWSASRDLAAIWIPAPWMDGSSFDGPVVATATVIASLECSSFEATLRSIFKLSAYSYLMGPFL